MHKPIPSKLFGKKKINIWINKLVMLNLSFKIISLNNKLFIIYIAIILFCYFNTILFIFKWQNLWKLRVNGGCILLVNNLLILSYSYYQEIWVIMN